jgi:hypothetical protein
VNRFDHLFFGRRPLRQPVDTNNPAEDLEMALTVICLGLVLLVIGGLIWFAVRTIFEALGRDIESS